MKRLYSVATRARAPVIAVLVGALAGWLSWIPPAHFSALWLLPLAWGLCARRAFRITMMAAYYAVASFLVEPAMASYFPHDTLAAPLVWLSCAALLTSPYAAACRWLPSGPGWVVAVLVTAVPPLGAIGLCSPLYAATAAFPGLGIAGLLLTMLLQMLLAAAHRPGMTIVTAIGAGAVVLLATLAPPSHIPSPLPAGWRALNTHVGRTPDSASAWLTRQIALKRSVAESITTMKRGSVLLTPEDIAGGWGALSPWAWRPIAAAARTRGVTVLLGTTLSLPGSHRADGFIYLGAATGMAIARQPIPIAEWHPLMHAGYGVGWDRFGPSYVGSHPVAVLVCYEQLLLWPAVWAWLGRSAPRVILAPGNHGWARGAPDVARLQDESVQALGRLFGVPVLGADNGPRER